MLLISISTLAFEVQDEKLYLLTKKRYRRGLLSDVSKNIISYRTSIYFSLLGKANQQILPYTHHSRYNDSLPIDDFMHSLRKYE